jgi:hypothetical protein
MVNRLNEECKKKLIKKISNITQGFRILHDLFALIIIKYRLEETRVKFEIRNFRIYRKIDMCYLKYSGLILKLMN